MNKPKLPNSNDKSCKVNRIYKKAYNTVIIPAITNVNNKFLPFVMTKYVYRLIKLKIISVDIIYAYKNGINSDKDTSKR